MISVFASAIRTGNWERILETVSGNIGQHELVFAGPVAPDFPPPPNFQWIETAPRLKPVQCYQIAAQACRGDLIVQGGDDIDLSPEALDLAEAEWRALEDDSAILSLRMKFRQWDRNGTFAEWDHTEKGCLFDTNDLESPKLPFMGVMRRGLFWDLGGYDRRFISSMHEADLALRAQASGSPIYFCTEAAGRENRGPQWNPPGYQRSYYHRDRQTLDSLWANAWRQERKIRRSDHLQRFDMEAPTLLEASQGNRDTEQRWR